MNRATTSTFLLTILGLLSLSGCATTNVRAMRAYANEDPQLVVALDRLDDIGEVLRLLDEAVYDTPYSPGDAWVSELALDDERAAELMAEVRRRPPYDEPGFHVPVVRLYRIHLAEILHAQRTRNRVEEADYPSLMVALKELHEGPDIGTLWQVYQRQIDRLVEAEAEVDDLETAYNNVPVSEVPGVLAELRKARRVRRERSEELEATSLQLNAAVAALAETQLDRGQRNAIAKDALVAFGVVLRNDLEAVALIPFLVANIVRSATNIDQWAEAGTLLAGVKRRRTFSSLAKLGDLPEVAEGISTRVGRQLELAEQMTDVLSELTAKDVTETAGFALEESVVDQIVGITLDSFHAELDVDAEMLMFGSLGGQEGRRETEDDDGNVTSVTDLTGRTRRLVYDVSPIFMLGIHGSIGFDFIKLPNAAKLGGGYTTDRVFSRGGSIEQTSLGEQLGLSGVASDIFNIGLGVLGVDSSVKIATFDFGQATELEVDPFDDEDDGIAEDAEGDDRITDFQLKYTQIDVGYDIAFLVSEWARRWYIEQIWFGYRYFDYRLPRIVYEVGGSEDFKSFRRQSPSQFVPTTYHMGGAKLRFGPSGDPRVRLFGDLGFFFGAGPVSYYFCEDDDDPCTEAPDESDRAVFEGSLGGMNVIVGLGTHVRLTPRTWPVMVHAGLE